MWIRVSSVANSGHTSLSHRALFPLLCKHCWGQVAEFRIPPLAIVEDRDVLGNFIPGLGADFIVPVMHQFRLERTPQKLSIGALSSKQRYHPQITPSSKFSNPP